MSKQHGFNASELMLITAVSKKDIMCTHINSVKQMEPFDEKYRNEICSAIDYGHNIIRKRSMLSSFLYSIYLKPHSLGQHISSNWRRQTGICKRPLILVCHLIFTKHFWKYTMALLQLDFYVLILRMTYILHNSSISHSSSTYCFLHSTKAMSILLGA